MIKFNLNLLHLFFSLNKLYQVCKQNQIDIIYITHKNIEKTKLKSLIDAIIIFISILYFFNFSLLSFLLVELFTFSLEKQKKL